MATSVKEIKLKKNGAMVSPIVLIDSLRNLDGTKYKDTVSVALNGKSNSEHTHDDRYYTESEIDSKVSSLNTAINGKADSSHDHVSWTETSSQEWAKNETIVEYQIPSVALGETAYIRHTFKNTYSGGNAYSCTFRVKAPSGGTMYCGCASSTVLQSEKFISPSSIIEDFDVTAGTSVTVLIRCLRIA